MGKCGPRDNQSYFPIAVHSATLHLCHTTTAARLPIAHPNLDPGWNGSPTCALDTRERGFKRDRPLYPTRAEERFPRIEHRDEEEEEDDDDDETGALSCLLCPAYCPSSLHVARLIRLDRIQDVLDKSMGRGTYALHTIQASPFQSCAVVPTISAARAPSSFHMHIAGDGTSIPLTEEANMPLREKITQTFVKKLFAFCFPIVPRGPKSQCSHHVRWLHLPPTPQQ
jgi:hypothetical protein